MAKAAAKKVKTKEALKRGRGRPRKVISAAEVAALAGIGCTEEEIAKVKGISVDTLHRNYAEAYEKGFANLKQSLRRKQVQLARAGDRTMLVWLGKAYLGQRDRSEFTGKDGSALVPGSIVFTMPKNGRDEGQVKPPVLAVEELAETPVAEELPVEPPPAPRVPAPPPPRYTGGGRDSRIVDDVRNVRPIVDGGSAASTGSR